MKVLAVGDVVRLKGGKTKYIIVRIKKEKVFIVSDTGIEGYFCIPYMPLIILKRKKNIYG